MLLNWWREGSPYADYDIVIADGAIRSGKTISMICSFLQFAQETFDGKAFIIAGKSIGTLGRNVVTPMQQILSAWGWPYSYNRGDNAITVGTNVYYMFGANSEASQDTLQGMTAAGALADEVALMPQSFVEQMIGRCSVTGAKIFLNCNPKGPAHWFYTDFIQKADEKHILYLHFVMADNLTLSEKTRTMYARMFTGVFYDRYIRGLWTTAEGIIYRVYAENASEFRISRDDLPRFKEILIGCDWGGNKSAHSFTAVGIPFTEDAVYVLSAVRYEAKDTDALFILNRFDDFYLHVLNTYGVPTDGYGDSAEQAILNLISNQGKMHLRNSIKHPILDRIRATTYLIARRKLFLTDDCEPLDVALKTALWDTKNSDARLDNGTTWIDPLDSFEYAWERYIPYLLRH